MGDHEEGLHIGAPGDLGGAGEAADGVGATDREEKAAAFDAQDEAIGGLLDGVGLRAEPAGQQGGERGERAGLVEAHLSETAEVSTWESGWV